MKRHVDSTGIRDDRRSRRVPDPLEREPWSGLIPVGGGIAVSQVVRRAKAFRLGDILRSASLFDLPLLAFAACAVLASRAAYEPVSARDAAGWILLWSVVGVATGWGARSRRAWRACAFAAVACGAIGAAVFVTQYSSMSVESKVGAVDALGRLLSLPFPRWALWEPFSNSAATWFEGLFLLGIGASWDDRFGRFRAPLAAMSGVLGLGLILTMSRGAWLGVLAGAACAGAMRWTPYHWRGTLAGASVMATIGIGLAMTFDGGLAFVNQLSTMTGGVLARPDRMDIYRNSATLLDAVGLTGLGPGGQFAQPFSRFALIIQVPFVTYPHQLSLHLWLAFGALGVTAWAWWVGTSAAAIAAAEQYRSSPAFRGAWAGVVAVLVHGLSDARQAVDPWTWGPLFVLTGLIVARSRRLGARPHPSRFAWSWSCLIVVAVLAAARHVPLSAAWHSSLGHQLEARCLFGGPVVADHSAACRLAIESYQQAVVDDPGNASVRRRLALVAAERGAFAEALIHANVALESDPYSLATRKVAGLVAAWAGEERLATGLLLTVPGSPDELLVWSGFWKDRGFAGAAQGARRVALALMGHAPDSDAGERR